MARNTRPKTDDKATAQTAPEAPQEGQETQEGTQGTQETQEGTQGTQETQEGTQGAQETQKGPEAPPPDPDVTVIVDYEAGLNLRDGPHRSFNSLAVVPNGAVLTVLRLPEGAEVPGWALIRCVVDDEPLFGWVCTDFVRED